MSNTSHRTCEVPGCERTHRARGMCATHWRRDQIHGSPDVVHPARTDAATRTQVARAAKRREERFEDVRWLMSSGTHPDDIARRVGASRAAIEKQAREWDAPDIARYMVTTARVDPTKPCPDCGCAIRRSSTRCVDCAYIARWVKGAA